MVHRTVVPAIMVLVVIGFASCSVGTIQTGNVGVRTTTVSPDEVQPCLYFKIPLAQKVDEYTAKETSADPENLTPKGQGQSVPERP